MWLICFLAALFPAVSSAQSKGYPLTSLKGLKLIHVTAEPATYNGRQGIRVTEPANRKPQAGEAEADRLVLLADSAFRNGSIETDLAGAPASGAMAAARGFAGIAFRVAPDLSRFECFYLRPTNGRAGDQVRRNHSAQYISFPDFPWQRLRKEEPEKYESYVDLAPGEWTKVRIEVEGVRARLFVHGSAQPTLLVNDLKLGDSRGAIALWIGPGTEAHFANMVITLK